MSASYLTNSSTTYGIVTVADCASCSSSFTWTRDLSANSNFTFLLDNRNQFIRYVRIYDYAKTLSGLQIMTQTSGCANDNFGNSCVECDAITGQCYDNADLNTYTDDVVNGNNNVDLSGTLTPNGYLINGTTGNCIDSRFTRYDSSDYFWREAWGDGYDMGFLECDDGNTISGDGCDQYCMIETNYSCTGGNETTPDTCGPWGNGILSTTDEQWDDGNNIDNDGWDSTCNIETGYTWDTNSPTACQKWGDRLVTGTEEWEDGNDYTGDGCSNTCTIETGWTWSDIDSSSYTLSECIRTWGNGQLESDEQCDDGNNFDYDGWDYQCVIETGYTCTGGTSSTPDTCIETQFMPTATLSVTSKNDLILTFNDTMINATIDNSDLYVQTYGPELNYTFTWTAEYRDENSVYIDTSFTSQLVGEDTEEIVVEFINRDKFKSQNSLRNVNPETELSGYLNPTYEESNTKTVGQTAMYVFLFSLFITLISSFGDYSVEIMWGLMNTLQIIYYINFIYVVFPTDLETVFELLSWANADNEYLAMLTFVILPKENFNQDEVNGKFGEKSFYINSADKVPVIFTTCILFLFTFVFDKLKLTQNNKWLKIVYMIVEFFKYNFFIRLGLEMFIELFFNGLVNIYFVSLFI